MIPVHQTSFSSLSKAISLERWRGFCKKRSASSSLVINCQKLSSNWVRQQIHGLSTYQFVFSCASYPAFSIRILLYSKSLVLSRFTVSSPLMPCKFMSIKSRLTGCQITIPPSEELSIASYCSNISSTSSPLETATNL